MDDTTGVTISGRTVPFPKSISPQARAFLASMVGPDGLPLNAMPQPEPDDLEGWAKSREAVGKFMTDFSAALSPHLRSSVETIEMAGARVHLATPADPAPKDRAYLDIHGGGLVHAKASSAGRAHAVSPINMAWPAIRWIIACPPNIPIPRRWATALRSIGSF